MLRGVRPQVELSTPLGVEDHPSIGSVVDDESIVVVSPVQADDRHVLARLGDEARQLLAGQSFHAVSITHASRAERSLFVVKGLVRGCRGALMDARGVGPGVGRNVQFGSGADLSEVPGSGFKPAALDSRVAPVCRPGPISFQRSSCSCRQTASDTRRFNERSASLRLLPSACLRK